MEGEVCLGTEIEDRVEQESLLNNGDKVRQNRCVRQTVYNYKYEKLSVSVKCSWDLSRFFLG